MGYCVPTYRRAHLVIGGGRIGLKSGEVNAPILGTGEAWAQVFSG